MILRRETAEMGVPQQFMKYPGLVNPADILDVWDVDVLCNKVHEPNQMLSEALDALLFLYSGQMPCAGETNSQQGQA